jgi:hypothetical protein
MGPQEWTKTSSKIAAISPMLGEAFKSMANFLKKLEDSQEDWHHAPIWGHSRTHKLFPFYPTDIVTLHVPDTASLTVHQRMNANGTSTK